VDLRDSPLNGQQGEDLLAAVDITVNRNAVPFDPRPPMVTSGLRIGTPALASRGFSEQEFREVADVIAETLIAGAQAASGDGEEVAVDPAVLASLRERVRALAAARPLYPELTEMGA